MDLNYIEHVWGIKGRRLSTLHHPSQTQLFLEIQISWNEMLQKDINYLILTLLRRVQEFIYLFIVLFSKQDFLITKN